MIFIDTHTHLYAKEFTEDVHEIMLRSKNEGVEKIFLPAIDSETHGAMIDLEAAYPDTCFAMMGLHPCSVEKDYKKELDIIEKYWAERSFCAVGEIGLDYYWSKEYIKEQKDAFRTQIRWAKEWKVPINIHARESLDDIISIIREEKTADLTGIFHCFGGSIEQGKAIIELGFLMGIGGVVTYPKAGLDKVLPSIGLENMVLETDAPYLTPVPHRGKRNEPTYIPIIAKRIADIMQVDIEKVADSTTKNALHLFKKTIFPLNSMA